LSSGELAIIPEELMARAFVATNGEAAWPTSDVAAVLDVLVHHKMSVLGGELWWLLPGSGGVSGSIPQRQGSSGIYSWETTRRQGEEWDAFLKRCAGDSLEAVRRWENRRNLPDDFQGRVLVNLTWVAAEV
jgi:hypothetical protein